MFMVNKDYYKRPLTVDSVAEAIKSRYTGGLNLH